MRIRTAALPLLAFGLVLAPDAAAQGDSIPEELARVLLFPFVPGEGPPPSIVAGQLPAEIPATVVPAGSTAVLGGLTYVAGHSLAIVTHPASPLEAIASYRSQLERDGWRHIAHEHFASSDARGVLGVCGNDGTVLVAWAAPRTGGGSTVSLRRMAGEHARTDFSAYCQGVEPERFPSELLPALRAPEGARHYSGSGKSGSFFEQETYTTFFSTLPTDEIAASYAAQLRDAGWTIGAPVGAGATVAIRVEQRDTMDRTWHGVVTVMAVDSQRDVFVRVSRAGTAPLRGMSIGPSVPAPAPAPAGRLPAALVRVFAALHGGGDGMMVEPEIVAGSLPPGMPGSAVPAGMAVLGGTTSPEGTVAILVAPHPPARAFADYRAELERTGWLSSDVDLLKAYAESAYGRFCGPGSAVIFASATERAAGGSYLHVQHSLSMGALCRPEYLAYLAENPAPSLSLRAPEGAVIVGGGSGSGGSGVRAASAQLQTALSAGELAAHYAAQLRQAAWTTTAPAGDGNLVTVTAERRDPRGRTWRTLLAVTAIAPAQSDVVVRVMGESVP